METNNGCSNQRIVVNESSFMNSEVGDGVKKEVVGKEDIEYFNGGVIDQCTEPEDNVIVEYNSNGILIEMDETRSPETELGENCGALEGEVLDSVDLIKTEKTLEYSEELNTEQYIESVDVHTQLRMHPDLTILKEEINGGDIPEHDEYEGFYTCHKESYTEMVYKCSICTFTTTYKNIIKNHILLLHMKYAPTIQTEKMRKCSFPGCNFQTLHSIKKHEQIHSNVFHKCDKCSFQTKRKEYLSSHVTRVHGKSLGMEIFRCDDCSYEATMKENLIQHQEVHKKPEDRKVLKCPVAACSYEAICRRTLKRHSLQHKDPSQVEILKCTKCPYYAIEKNALWKHTKRMHATNQSEREVFRCDKCQFQTYNKPSIRGHVLIHANRVEMFKCPHCSYETKRKYNLTQHLVKHKSSSEMETFKCAMCSFETKRKNCIRNHIVAHMKSKNRR